jgi:adenine deaminase
MNTLSGHIVDVLNRRLFDGVITLDGDKIADICPCDTVDDQYLTPGLIDAHIHIESSMMPPSEFARQVLPRGTVACVCDPHEIANVCGIPGIDFMIVDGKKSPLCFWFGAPSCVPATTVETSGAVLDAEAVRQLLQRDDIGFLAEMMNFPGVLLRDEQVLLKLKAARALNKPIDGHAPGLTADDLRAYVEEGIQTDHECSSLAEAKEKIALGMHILVREGSAARNLEALLPLLTDFPHKIMFCSDDKHPDDLFRFGHIDHLVRRAVEAGYPVLDVLQACCVNPVKHYKLPVGLLQKGDPADFLVVRSLSDFRASQTWIRGQKVAADGQVCYPAVAPTSAVNAFHALPLKIDALRCVPTHPQVRVMVAQDDQLLTHSERHLPRVVDGNAVSDPDRDLLKIVVYNRYQSAPPAIGFIRNFGLKRGAIASTIAHDSHNLVAVGTSDLALAEAINRLIECKGGIIAKDGNQEALLPLPIGGLMAEGEGQHIAETYRAADSLAKQFGATLRAPFMTLAFMSLLVIPELKLSDRGLFEIQRFSFTDLFCEEE